ncbi:MAG: bifunctional precorrin-2 dehydrogenase/sirohydrochlorin ferrochelatase [Desulfobulbaceae bacterium]|nr:bifunctional precorrin-2 dehydrogenase/sirohydrochlorin ferrochelatase [Desulfobulbaceae bacterium]
MKYYPICLQIEGRRCLVVGGGKVAERKVQGLLESGASVVVISPELTESLRRMQEAGEIAWQERGYLPGDVVGFFLVMAATDDRQVQDQVQADAERHQILLNVADVPEKCNFILPALVKRGPLSIAISTSGKSPALAKRLRREMQGSIGQDYECLTEVMGLIRPYVLRWNLPQAENERIFQSLVDGDILEHIRRLDWPGLQAYLERGLKQELPLELVQELKKLLEQ